jgi:hypothetical protein
VHRRVDLAEHSCPAATAARERRSRRRRPEHSAARAAVGGAALVSKILPTPIKFESQREFVRTTIAAEVDLRAD